MPYPSWPTPAGPRPGVLRRRLFAGWTAVAFALAALTPAAAHVVQPGETLSGIADQYGVPIEELASINGLTNTDHIEAGQDLLIPGGAAKAATVGRQYVVAAGDTLTGIASGYGVTLQGLMAANGIDDADAITVGQVLTIPGAVAPAAVGGRQHTVQPGETLGGIAGYWAVPLQALLDANGLRDPDSVVAGQVLTVPNGRPGAASGSGTHVVVAGESLSAIAGRYGVAADVIIAANGLADANHIFIGQTLIVPGALASQSGPELWQRTHIVAAGETLSGIADEYEVGLQALEQANGLRNPDHVFAGQVLVIPGNAAAAAPRVASRTHIVTEGQSLADIALRYGTTVAALVEMNGLANSNLIQIGQVLAVPSVVAPVNRGDYASILASAAAEFGLPANLVKAVAWQESGWNQAMVSSTGAIGVMQVMPGTADWALENLVADATEWDVDPLANARMGAAILRHWLLESGWDIELSLAAYYQGWQSVHTIGFYDDTKEYIANVLAIMASY